MYYLPDLGIPLTSYAGHFFLSDISSKDASSANPMHWSVIEISCPGADAVISSRVVPRIVDFLDALVTLVFPHN